MQRQPSGLAEGEPERVSVMFQVKDHAVSVGALLLMLSPIRIAEETIYFVVHTLEMKGPKMT